MMMNNPRASMMMNNPRASVVLERSPTGNSNKPKEVTYTAESVVGKFSLFTVVPDNKPHHMLFKIVLIGNSGVGKTNLLYRWMDNDYADKTSATIAIEFSTKSFNIDNNIVKVQLWDTAGQEKFKAVTQAYYRNSHGAILVYDVTDASSFTSLNVWLQTLKESPGNEDIKIMLIGNKRDMEHDRQVQTSKGMAWSREKELYFLETSAKEGINVHRAFQILLEEIYKSMLDKINRNAVKKINIHEKETVVIDQRKPVDSCCADLFGES